MKQHHPKTRARYVKLLAMRDGDWCALCHAKPLIDPLEIDHIEPDGPDEPENWRLLCKACNAGRRRNAGEKLRGMLCEGGADEDATRTAKQALPYGEGSPEMRSSGWFEVLYRDYVKLNVPMPKSEAIDSGSEASGCSITTAERYLRKLCSKAGPMRVYNDEHGVAQVAWKTGKAGGEVNGTKP